jgi:hypothetical protein
VHGGVAAGEFQMFKYAPLAARSGGYRSYDSPADQYHRNCISTNVVLFTNVSDPNDRGDQNSRRGLKHDHATWDQWLAIRDRYGLDVAHILDWRVIEGEARCKADLTATNSKGKCRRWIREFIWLADKHLVVLDIVETVSSDTTAQWQLHCPSIPRIGDRLITVDNRPPERSWADPELRPESEEARLFCQILAPQDYTVFLTAEGKTQTFDSDGQSRGFCRGNRYHQDFGSDVVQIDPGNEKCQTVFLLVLTAADKDRASPPETKMKTIRRGELELYVNDARTTLAVPGWFRHPPDDR